MQVTYVTPPLPTQSTPVPAQRSTHYVIRNAYENSADRTKRQAVSIIEPEISEVLTNHGISRSTSQSAFLKDLGEKKSGCRQSVNSITADIFDTLDMSSRRSVLDAYGETCKVKKDVYRIARGLTSNSATKKWIRKYLIGT